MNKEKLSTQHAQLKEQLAELTDFINSEEYYKLTDQEKNIISAQRTGMEIALSSMSVRLWGDKTNTSFNPSMFGLMSLMFSNTFSSPSLSLPPLPELPQKDEEKTKEEGN